MKNLLLSSLDVDFYFSWFLVTQRVAEMEEKLYLRGISGFACLPGSAVCLEIWWGQILDFILMKILDFILSRNLFGKSFLLYQNVGDIAPLPHFPCARTLFPYLHYFYFIYMPVQI